MTANLAQSHAELREAAYDLAAAQQMAGLDRWSAFVADAEQRARDSATTVAIEKSEQPPNPRKDTITPTRPLPGTSRAPLPTGWRNLRFRASGYRRLRSLAEGRLTIMPWPRRSISRAGYGQSLRRLATRSGISSTVKPETHEINRLLVQSRSIRLHGPAIMIGSKVASARNRQIT